MFGPSEDGPLPALLAVASAAKGGGVRIQMRLFDHAGSNGVQVYITPARLEVFAGCDNVVGVPALPDLVRGCEAIRKAAANPLHCSGHIARGEEKVDVVGHGYERV